jgi:tetratricopeptide (TPR) repeat protein
VDNALVLERKRSESLLKQSRENGAAAAEASAQNDRFSAKVKQLETQLGVATRATETLGGRLKEREAEMQALVKAERATRAEALRTATLLKEQIKERDGLLAEMKQGLNRTLQQVQDLREEVSAAKAATQAAGEKAQAAQAAWVREKEDLAATHGQALQALARERDTARHRAGRLYARRLATIGIFHKQNGETEKALTAFRQALEHDPENKQARHGMGLILKDQAPPPAPPEKGAPETTNPAPDGAVPEEAPVPDETVPEEAPVPDEAVPEEAPAIEEAVPDEAPAIEETVPEEAAPDKAPTFDKPAPDTTPAKGGEAA